MPLLEQLTNYIVRALQPLKRRYAAPAYDSETHSSESYYAEQYLHYIDSHVPHGGAKPLRVLDAGCGTGRFAMALARRGYGVTAVDVSGPSLTMLRRKAEDAHLDNLHIVQADLHKLGTELGQTFDMVICLEVLYTSETRERVTRELLGRLRPGGVAFITHRPKHYFLLSAIAAGRFDEATMISEQSEGRLKKGAYSVYYNWQTAAQIRALYDRIGVKLHAMKPIGAFSGFSVDPLSRVCDPGALQPSDRQALLKLELGADDDYLMNGRYVLAIVEKPA